VISVVFRKIENFHLKIIREKYAKKIFFCSKNDFFQKGVFWPEEVISVVFRKIENFHRKIIREKYAKKIIFWLENDFFQKGVF
jgi:hypothetical protein